MFLDKTLLLKGVAGVATVGGVIGGGYFLNHQLSKKEAEVDQAPRADSSNVPGAEGGKEPQSRVDNVASQQTQDHGARGDGAVVGPEGGAKIPSGPSPEEIAKQKEAKKTEINGKLTTLGLDGCHLQDSDLSSPTVFSKDCELDEAKLKLINFSNKGTDSVTISGLNGGNLKLNISNKTNGIKYTFSGASSKITISGDQDKPYITLKNGETREFEDKNGKLSKVPSSRASNATALNTKLKNLKIPNKCWFEEGETEGPEECELNQTELQKIPFSNKAENNDVTVTGLNGGNIKLKIEKKNNNEIKYTFSGHTSQITISGDSTKPDIVLKANGEREFEDKNGKLGKVSLNDKTETQKITNLNKKLSDLKIPDKCRFDETEKDETIECDLSNKEADLKKIDFSNKEKNAESKIEGSTAGLKLTINRLNDVDSSKKHSPQKDLEFIFSGYSGEIKIQDNRTGGDAYSDIILKLNTNPIFTMTDTSAGSGNENRLAKSFSSRAIANKLGLSCSGSSPLNCTPDAANKPIKLLNSSGNDIEDIRVVTGQENDQILSAQDDVDGCEQGIKFTGKKAFPSSGDSPKIEANAEYYVKYLTGKGWALSKKT